MKSKCLLYIVSFLSCLFSSCNKDNYGFAEKVSFTSKGGEFILVGAKYVQTLIIEDYDGLGESSQNTLDDEEISASYLWLTAKTKPFSETISLIAEPNDSGNSRTLYVRATIGNSHAEIEVIQE